MASKQTVAAVREPLTRAATALTPLSRRPALCGAWEDQLGSAEARRSMTLGEPSGADRAHFFSNSPTGSVRCRAATTSGISSVVHGGSSNSRAWSPLRNELALLGQSSYAVDAVYRLAEHGPVVLVGTSLGGLTISAVAHVVHDMLDRVVYRSALCLIVPAMLTEPWDVVDDNLLRITVPDVRDSAVVRPNWRSAHTDPPLKTVIMADATDDRFRALLDSMDPDENGWGRPAHLRPSVQGPLHHSDRPGLHDP
ncbi:MULTISPECIES: alpha/beta fold hydrolase [Streptomyces]|uniref:Alpha/beta fold hydrolase n=1 Tax=Streptomyces eurythermus TaxID=42237 RepID=A0ABW6YZK1_9ACTN|nr:hypothetical protein [Streptomyces sp. DSM 40868]